MRKLIPALLLLTACQPPAAVEDGPNDSFFAGGKADVAGIADGSADALAVLRLVNESDEPTLQNQIGLSERAASNIVEYRLGDDETAGTADDQTFDTLEELDAIPYVGPIAFEKLLAYAHAHTDACTGASCGWQSTVPDQVDLPVYLPAQSGSCQPNCITHNTKALVTLHVSKDGTGAVQLSFTHLSYLTVAAQPVAADGTFDRTDPISYSTGSGSVSLKGHFEKNAVVIEAYDYEFTNSNGMFAGWQSYLTSTGPGSATF